MANVKYDTLTNSAITLDRLECSTVALVAEKLRENKPIPARLLQQFCELSNRCEEAIET